MIQLKPIFSRLDAFGFGVSVSLLRAVTLHSSCAMLFEVKNEATTYAYKKLEKILL
jgi:hypothetical protein